MDHLDPNVSLFAVARRGPLDNSARKLRVKDAARGFIRERVATKAVSPRSLFAFTCQNASQKYARSCRAASSIAAQKEPGRFKAFAILSRRLRRCKKRGFEASVFKDLKQRNMELFPSKSPRRVPFYTFRFYALGYIRADSQLQVSGRIWELKDLREGTSMKRWICKVHPQGSADLDIIYRSKYIESFLFSSFGRSKCPRFRSSRHTRFRTKLNI